MRPAPPSVHASTAPLAGVTALYGGSFNPPHVGHQMACTYLLEALGAEAVWLLPAARHAFGKSLQPFAHRQRMVELMAAPLGPRVQVCAIEATLAGVNTTYATWTALRQRFPQRRWAVVVGADLVPGLAGWAEARALFAGAELVVLGRAGYPLDKAQISFPPRPWRAEPTVDLPQVSSTWLRQRLARGAAVTGYVPWAVARYVAEHDLYRDAQAP